MGARVHTIRYGETLESISEAYYRSPEFDNFIYSANTHVILNPNRLDVGQHIVIPHLPVTSQLLAMMDRD
jgi:nucleoid-associated protein YgaU